MSCFVLQVLRYHQSGEPLWVSDEGKPSEDDIPRCDCGSERVFEFQVMMMVAFKAFKSHDNGTFSMCVVFCCSQCFEQKILFFVAKLKTFSGVCFVQFLSLQLISKDHFCTLK